MSDLLEMLSADGECGLMLSLAGGLSSTGDGSLKWGEWVRDDALGVTGDFSVCSAPACGNSVIWHGVVTEGVDWDASDGVADAARSESLSSKIKGLSVVEFCSSDLFPSEGL